MNKKKLLLSRQQFLEYILLGVVIVIFIAIRALPIMQHVTPYTYDQGRDFLKTEEIIRYKNLTFIGPTTGIMGLFHGAWWYYILSIPYILFNGWPLGFFIFMLLLTIISTFSFYTFLKKEFGFIPSILWLSIVTISPYFTPAAYQASNNFLVPHFILLLLFSIYKYFKTNKYIYFFLASLAAGFILESEVAFGMFMIPAFLLLLVIFPQLKKALFSRQGILSLIVGMLIPLSPRLLFELKNHFLQTKTIINFFIQPKLHNPRDFMSVVIERTALFWDYYKSIFYSSNALIALLFLIGSITAFIYLLKKMSPPIRITSLYCIGLTLLLYTLSLVYKDNFWGNYYEGIEYIFLFNITLVFAALYKSTPYKTLLSLIVALYVGVAIIGGIWYFTSTKAEVIGLRRMEEAVDYVQSKKASDNYCVRVYTPPVVPYTYNYLFAYNERVHTIPQPKLDFVNKQCWYIIEDDSFQFRIDQWRKNNIPTQTRLIERKRIGKETTIEKWQY